MRFFRFCFSWISFIVFLGSCAIQVPPQGGEKDIEPPKILSSEPANYSTGFDGKIIQINFDEYINLNDITTQLIVSPLLKYPPETRIRKKTLTIELKDTLLENTTYTLNFGDGIVDNNEGNKLNNFQYVFSTGPIIDSLSIRGKIKNAFDRKTEKGILALLYHETSDSIPYLERPVYFSKTNDSGMFRISNISPGHYKLIGLKEKDGNYLYTRGEEMIAFPDSLIESESDNLNLELFTEIPVLRFLRAYSEMPGKAVLVFNVPADTVRWNWLTDTTKLNIYSIDYSKTKDSISIWYKNALTDSLSLCFDNYSIKDTVTLRLFKKNGESKGRQGFAMTISESELQTYVQHLHLPRYFQCNRPLATADFNKIIFLEDSVPAKPVFVFTNSLKTKFNLEYKWKENGNYSLFIPPGTFADIFGDMNDTLEYSFPSHSETDYGSIKINFQKKGNSSYVLQLLDDAGKVVFREFSATKDTIVEWNNLDPRSYKVKLIDDRNSNGKWDTGIYLDHIQPEAVEFYPETIIVRANWDVDVAVKAPIN